MTTLYDDGIKKVLRGITTPEEVMRVASRVEKRAMAAGLAWRRGQKFRARTSKSNEINQKFAPWVSPRE